MFVTNRGCFNQHKHVYVTGNMDVLGKIVLPRQNYMCTSLESDIYIFTPLISKLTLINFTIISYLDHSLALNYFIPLIPVLKKRGFFGL